MNPSWLPEESFCFSAFSLRPHSESSIIVLRDKKTKEGIANVEEIRLNKYLSEAGVCSRREADRLIEAGKVLVDGQPAVMGMRVRPDQEIQVGKKVIGGSREERVLLAVYKPPGVICTTDPQRKAQYCGLCGISGQDLSHRKT